MVVGDAGVDVLAKHDAPIAPGDDRSASVRIELGGAAANTAAWLAHVGAVPVLVGRVGDDPTGRQVRTELTEAGVRCALAVDHDAHTCCVVVLVDGLGQRSMLPDRGASARLQPEDLTPELLAEASHLHLSGYVLLDERSAATGVAMLRAAKAAGLSTSVDPQSAALLIDRTAFLDAVRGVDLLLPNSAELAALTSSTDPDSARSLLDVVGAVAVTSGDAGADWLDATGHYTVPALAAECVDSTGAGDAFDAALLAAWLGGSSPLDALRAGVAAGATVVGRLGAHPASDQPSIT
ncbi:MAG TPA: PfkB family carbohydrate kinase, partial [Pseudonocardiaceae bacterium]|nr:PfkB family carbohydrate kinase [Pseudonocardiaceae bacterium]